MIADFFINFFQGILRNLPIVSLPEGMVVSLNYVKNVIGFVNVFLPVTRLLPIIAMIVLVRRFNIVTAIINWIIRLIPFIG